MLAPQSIHLYRHLSVLHPFRVNCLIYIHPSDCTADGVIFFCASTIDGWFHFRCYKSFEDECTYCTRSITDAIVRALAEDDNLDNLHLIIMHKSNLCLPCQVSHCISNGCAFSVTVSSSIFFVFIKVTAERACWAFLFLKRRVPREPRHIWLQRMLVMYGCAGW